MLSSAAWGRWWTLPHTWAVSASSKKQCAPTCSRRAGFVRLWGIWVEPELLVEIEDRAKSAKGS